MWSGFASHPFEEPRDSLWAVAPLFLFGIGISLNSLVRGGPYYSIPSWRLVLGVALGLLPMLLIAAMSINALIRRIPDGYWVWVGAGFMGFTLFVETVSEERAELGKAILSPTGDTFIAITILVAWTALIITAALRGWRQAGLLGMGLSGSLGLSFFLSATAAPFFRHDLALAAAPIGALFSLLAFVYLRSSSGAVRTGTLAGSLAINLFSIAVANRAWADGMSVQKGAAPTLLLVFSAGLLLSSPLLWLIKRPLERALERG